MQRHKTFFEKYAKDNVDALIVLSPLNNFYYTGFKASNGAFIATRKGKAVYLTDFRYTEDAREKIATDIEVELVGQDAFYSKIKQILKSARANIVGVEGDFLAWSAYDRLAKELDFCTLINVSVEIERQKAIKTEDEISNIAKAQDIAEKALTKLLPKLKVGVTEFDIAAELNYIALKLGSEAPAFDTIVAFGANSSKPHAKPSDNKLAKGDMVLIDFGCKTNGYCSDMTRTFAFYDKPDARLERIYDIVLKAQIYAINNIKAGVSCKEADSYAREFITANGYGEYFGHGLGHGVGIYVHELPRVSSRSEEVLMPGMVITVEPGIYVSGLGGVRIEDLLVIRDGGTENLTKFAKALRVL
ncbi:MAG: Xaa-Pro peptidase family protein [Firmicutes bacterium]|nr:Xaa-Pro peptidase family protein [Bacillota bacterium]